jgi:hypothetical protein
MNLLELTQTGLSSDNKENFKLDKQIILCKKDGLSPIAISVLLNITISKLGGRVASLVRRGNLPKLDKPTPSRPKQGMPLKNDVALRNNIIDEIRKGTELLPISNLLNVSISTVTRIKHYITINTEVSEPKAIEVELPNSNGYEPLKNKVELRTSIIAELSKGATYKAVGDKFNISYPTLTKIKAFMIQNPNIVITKNTYSNSDGLNKEFARLKMATYILDSNSVGLVLTLPHIKWSIEKKILNVNPNYTFLGVETELDTFIEMKATAKNEKLPSKCYNGLLSDKMYGKHEDTYTHIIADYCGGIAKHSKEIEYALRNNIIKRGGIFAITIGKAIRGKGKNSDFIMSLGATVNNYDKDPRCDSDRAIEAFFNRNIGNDYEFLEIFNYTDKKESGKGYPMTLIILRRK